MGDWSDEWDGDRTLDLLTGEVNWDDALDWVEENLDWD